MKRVKDLRVTNWIYKYILMLIGFAAVCILRFFDRKLEFHSTPLGIMQNYRFAQVITAGYFVAFIILAFFILKKVEADGRSKLVAYLVMFAGVFMFPMFLYTDYFGATDIYAWIICFCCMFLIIIDRCVWLIPVGMFIMTAICPMSVIFIALLLFMILVNRCLDTSKKLYLFCAISGLLLSIIGLIVNISKGIFTTDVQGSLTLTRFIIALILVIPYIILGILFLRKLCVQEVKVNKICHILTMTLGVVAPVMYVILGDYGRAFFYGFVYYIFIVLVQVVMNNEKYISSLYKTYMMVSKYVIFPGVLIAYPFIIMVLWASGPVTLFEETFVGL